MALNPPERWGSGSVIGNGLTRRRRLSEMLIRQTRGDAARTVIQSWVFPDTQLGPRFANNVYPILFDGSIDLDPISILQQRNETQTALNLTPFLGDLIMLATFAPAGLTGDATLSVSATTSATGSTGIAAGASALTATVTTTTAGVVGKIGSASTVAETVTTTATGVVGKVGAASTTTVTASTTAAGVAAVTGSASTTAVTVTVTAAGTVSSGLVGDATLTETVTTTAAGNVATFGAATLTATVTTTAAGVVNRIGAATLTETVTVTTAGTVGKIGAATVAETVTITAAGAVNITGGATVTTVTVTVTAAGVVEAPATLDASLSLTVVTNAAGVIQRMFFTAPAQTFKRGRRYGTQTSWWVPQSVGVTVWRKDGVWHEQIDPPPWVTEGADRLYLGGRAYEIGLTEQSELVAAGFGDGIYLG